MYTIEPQSLWKRSLMLGAPFLLMIFSLLHGADELVSHGIPDADELVRYISTIQGRWLLLHVSGLGLFPLLGLVVQWMLPSHGPASRVSRLALAAYIVLYPAFDALVGIGSSILIRYRQTLSPTDQAVLDPVIKSLFFDSSSIAFVLAGVASLTWGIGAIAAAVALWRRRSWQVGLPLIVAGVAMTLDHAPPFGVVGGAMLALAVWQFLVREQRDPIRSVTGVNTA
jgi:hypothetical protein